LLRNEETDTLDNNNEEQMLSDGEELDNPVETPGLTPPRRRQQADGGTQHSRRP
jgi:hypothetical protein